MSQYLDVCVPSRPRGACASCARKTRHVEGRQRVTLDASAIEIGVIDCRMWVQTSPPAMLLPCPAVEPMSRAG